MEDIVPSAELILGFDRVEENIFREGHVTNPELAEISEMSSPSFGRCYLVDIKKNILHRVDHLRVGKFSATV